MTDRPILFTATNVALIRQGLKTETRRLATSPLARCQIGDRLYVREPWRTEALNDQVAPRDLPQDAKIWFESDHLGQAGRPQGAGRLRPGMFLPREHTRTTLILTNVRQQCLQDITDKEAKAEGMRPFMPARPGRAHILAYRDLWNRLHARDRWHNNPLVIALTFKVIDQNIDTREQPPISPSGGPGAAAHPPATASTQQGA